jgi:hypothetical protein
MRRKGRCEWRVLPGRWCKYVVEEVVVFATDEREAKAGRTRRRVWVPARRSTKVQNTATATAL